MLLHVTWSFADRSEAATKRSLAAFAAWSPPEGADSAETFARTVAPWAPWLSFTVTPILPIQEGSAIAGEGVAFRESVA